MYRSSRSELITECDHILLEPEEITSNFSTDPISRRKFLQTTAKFYDPLELFSPVYVIGKLLFQDIWCRGIGWNELLSSDLGAHWHTWVSALSSLSQTCIPHWLGTSRDSSTQVHVFCDASEKSYGAALYIRTSRHDTTLTNLACSKNKLAPVKKVTLHDWNS